ncbi:hypothetical protein MY9_2345 [Bacillus sp. JS]|nr:hypothetical protein MY9_2345 [Bacillus sp. JS]
MQDKDADVDAVQVMLNYEVEVQFLKRHLRKAWL